MSHALLVDGGTELRALVADYRQRQGMQVPTRADGAALRSRRVTTMYAATHSSDTVDRGGGHTGSVPRSPP